MASKLGPHLMSGSDITRWIAAGARIFKADPTQLGATGQIPTGPLVVGKLDQQDDALNLTDWKAYRNQGWTPEQTAEHRFKAQTNIYAGANRPRVNRYEANPRVDVWEDDNEVMPDNAVEAKWYAAYCIAMMGWYDTIGKKRANFSFAVGTPRLEIWPELLGAVAYAHRHGHYIALHEYMGYEADYGVGWRQIDGQRRPLHRWHGRKLANGQPDESYPYGYAALRYRLIYDTIFRPAGYGDVRLLITELGCDSVESVTPAGISVGTWKEHTPHWAAEGKDPEATYANMLKWYDARIREDAFVAGAVVFTVGSVGIWRRWDIAGTRVESDLLDYVAAVGNLPDPTPTEEEPMETLQQWLWRVAAQSAPTNTNAALQKALIAAGYFPYGKEFWADYKGVKYAIQPGMKDFETDARVVAFARVPQWNVVQIIDEPEPEAAEFRFEAWPTDYKVVTQEFGANPGSYAQFGLPGHEGVDVRAPLGTPIYAVADGVVYLKTGNEGNYGIQVRIEHTDGWQTVYAHLSQAQVIQSQRVSAGERIGLAGSTGNSSGPHLHLTLKKAGTFYVDKFGTWPNSIHDPTPFLAAFEGVAWPGGSPGIPKPTPPPAEKIDLRRFKIADPDCWRVVKATMTDGRVQNEDVQDMDLGGGMFVRRKGSNGEWHRQDGQLFYLIHDTSPDKGEGGIDRCYTLYKDGKPGAPKSRVFQAVGEGWIESGTHTVQFRSKAGCLPLGENSGPARNSSTIVRYERNYIFNRYGQGLRFDEVLWEKTGVETQIYGRMNGRACGWIGWSAPWGESEPVEVHWNRGRLNQEPKRWCNWVGV